MAKQNSSRKHRRRRARRRAFRIIVSLIALALIALIAFMLMQKPELLGGATPTPQPSATPVITEQPTEAASTPSAQAPTTAPTDEAVATELPTAAPTTAPTSEPAVRGQKEIDVSALSADVLPGRRNIDIKTKVYANGAQVDSYSREESISLKDPSLYSSLEGVTTFRGNNFRNTGSFGTVPVGASSMSIRYSMDIGSIDEWSGVGWTGQPAIVRWPEGVRRNMNIVEGKRDKDGLVEVIYATLDGKIYFFDLEDGAATREPIRVGAPIKGSVSVDPRGYPLLYVGQGIAEVHGSSVPIGMRVFSLIDQSELLFINGRDEFATRKWYASDCAPLLDAATDTLIWPGENGIFYTVTLNSLYDEEAGTISIDPVIDRYWYSSDVTKRPGMENSVAVYNHYAYFADNSGLITCLDLNTLTPVWAFNAGDDTDATLVLEEDTATGTVYLYTGCELDLTAKNGKGPIYLRCLNALTGEEVWNKSVNINDNSDRGGLYATPALGKGVIKDLVFFAVSRSTEENGDRNNKLFALNKKTGEEAWVISTGGYSWSSPTLTYDGEGRAYLFQNNSNGDLKMIDAQTGEIIEHLDLGSNVEGSPVIFDNILVIGTRGRKIFGVTIQ